MGKCVNIKHQDFLDMVEKSGENPMILSAKMGIWMEENNTDEYPTLKDLGLKDISKPSSLKEFKKAKEKVISESIEERTYTPITKEEFSDSEKQKVIDEFLKPFEEEIPDEISVKTNDGKKYELQEAINNVVSNLKSTLSSYGIDVDIQIDMSLETRGQVEYDGEGNAVIKVNPSLMTDDTIFHEFSHLYIDLLGMEHPAVIDAINALKGTGLWIETETLYPELNEEQLAKEVLAEAMGRKGSDMYLQDSDLKGLSFLIRKIFRALANLFKTDVDTIEHLVKSMYENDLQKITGGNIAFKALQKESSYESAKKTYTSRTVLENIKSNLKKQIAIAKKNNTGKLDSFIARKEILLDKIDIGSNSQGIIDYIEEAVEETKKASEIFRNLKKSSESFQNNAKDTAELLELKNYMDSYNILDEIKKLPEYSSFSESTKSEYLKQINEAILLRTEIQEEYFNTSRILISGWLWNSGKDAKEAFAKALKKGKDSVILSRKVIFDTLAVAKFDISMMDALFSPIISSRDAILALFAKETKRVIYEADETSKIVQRDLEEAFREVKKANPTKSAQEIFDSISEVTYFKPKKGEDKRVKDAKGLVQKYDILAFKAAQVKFYQELGKTHSGNTKEERDARDKVVRQWYIDNTQNNPDIDRLVEENKELVKQGLKTQEEYDHWIKERVKYDEDGEFVHYKHDFIIPSDNFINKKYEAIQNDSSLKAFYDKVVDSYLESQESLPEDERLGYILPFIEKFAHEKEIKDRVKDAVTPGFIGEADNSGDAGMETPSGKPFKFVPIHFTTYMDPSEVTGDIMSSVIQFTNSTNKYKALNDINAHANMLRDLLASRSVLKTNTRGGNIIDYSTKKLEEAKQRFVKEDPDKKSNALSQFDNFLERVYYEEEVKHTKLKVPFTDNKELDVDKLVDSLLRWTSISALSLNTFQAVNNIAMGNVMTYAEGAGGKLWTRKDWTKGQGIYLTHLGGFISDFGKDYAEKSLISMMVEEFDAMQGEYTEVEAKMYAGSKWGEVMSTNSFFFLQHMGEHNIQVSSFIAATLAYKVKDKNGNEILDSNGKPLSLYKAFKKENGKLVLDSRVEFTAKDKELFRNSLHATNKKLHGVYNEFDKASAQRYMIGKLGLLFRRWIYSGFSRRYQRYQIDYELNDVSEGTYRTFGRVLTKDLVEYKGNAIKMWDTLDEDEKANIRKVGVDATVILSSIILGAICLGAAGEPDKKKGYVNNFIGYQARRLRSEVLFFMPFVTPGETWRILKTPTASMGPLDSFGDLATQMLRPTERYKKNSGLNEKGDLKINAPLRKLLPAWGNLEKLMSPEEVHKSMLGTYKKQ